VRTVDTTSGALAGRLDPDARRFLGVPFAAPPLDGLRMRAPAQVTPWPGVRDASVAAAAPMQPRVVGLGMRGAARSDEDCLYLNVFAPAADGARRPVLFWLFGGGYLNGDAADPLFDGGRLAQAHDLVVVTANYRLGAFGFSAIGDANVGLADQIAALEWIRTNVERFGGDPDTVCVAGESAGAMSVCNLLAAPAARGLFHRAIAQSGAADNVATQAQASSVAHALRETLAADPRTAPAEALLAAQSAVVEQLRAVHRAIPFRPWIDGTLLPRHPVDLAAESTVPLLTGINRDEQRLYVRSSLRIDTEALTALIERRLTPLHPDPGFAARRVLDHYTNGRPRSPINANAAILADVDTELRFRRPMLRYAAARRAPTWIYQFDWPSPALRGWLGACHAIEVPFVFGNFSPPGTAKFAGAGPEADALALDVMARWAGFVRHGHPGADWPAYDAADPRQMHLDRAIRVRRLADDPTVDFWNGLLVQPAL
jgi:para-nitrobenzyl esterase